jgi:hypothetical protein
MAPGQGTRSSSYEVATDDNPYNFFLQQHKRRTQYCQNTRYVTGWELRLTDPIQIKDPSRPSEDPIFEFRTIKVKFQ